LKASPEGIRQAKKQFDYKNWTQEYLAIEVGVKTRQPIWRFFAGKPIERYTFFEICASLDLDWQDIVEKHPLKGEDLAHKKSAEPANNKLETIANASEIASVSKVSSLPVEVDKRHYGLNESSHYYCAQRSAEVLERDIKELRLITCNLDNGCSLAAIHNGKIIDTATGFTPLEGLMIDYSSGSIDPNVLNEMMRKDNEIDSGSEDDKKSSLVDTSEFSSEPRSVGSAIDTDNLRAKQALDIYLHRLRSCLGSMLMVLGGMDAIVFTSESSDNSEIIRELVCQSLEFLGLKLDLKQNQNDPVDSDIATTHSKVRVLVIQPQET
jgi:acetate kinase